MKINHVYGKYYQEVVGKWDYNAFCLNHYSDRNKNRTTVVGRMGEIYLETSQKEYCSGSLYKCSTTWINTREQKRKCQI